MNDCRSSAIIVDYWDTILSIVQATMQHPKRMERCAISTGSGYVHLACVHGHLQNGTQAGLLRLIQRGVGWGGWE